MKHPFHLLSVVLMILLAAAQSGASTLRLYDAGRERDFEVALDEIQTVDAAGARALQHVAPVADIAGVAQAARDLARASGERATLVLYEAGAARNVYTRRVLTTRLLVELEPGADARAVARSVGASIRRTPAASGGMLVFEIGDAIDALSVAEGLWKVPSVVWAQPLLGRLHQKKFVPNDTLFGNQWHLRNTGQSGGTAGRDVNVTNVWNTRRGAGIMIGIVDDGLQVTHPDLSPNVNTVIDWDWNGDDADPSPNLSIDHHGSACAGVAAAKGNNSLGVSGAAFDATLVGLRLISDFVDDSQEAEAMAHSNDLIFIKSNSWGPYDDGETLEGPGTLTRSALAAATSNGRAGKGTIFAWAAGNGLDAWDDANYDGYANSMYTIAISAVDHNAVQSWYSEPGACIVAASPSSGDVEGITTTDLVGANGYDSSDYTADFGGTSSATPLAAGVIALVLEANTNLAWRDVQEILIRSATKNDPSDSDWTTNGAGFHMNHKYGGGLINADAAVAMALTWTNLGARTSTSSLQSGLGLAIPDGNPTGITRTFDLNESALRVEHVTVKVNITHPYRGDLAITLTSPSGTVSRLTEEHADAGNNYSDWTLMSVRNWGEPSWGTWSVKVADVAGDDAGTLNAIELTIYGTLSPDATNRPPQITTPGSQTINVTNLLTFNVSAVEPDNDQVILSASNLPSGATFNTVTNNGGVTNTFNWTPATNQVGLHSVTFYASDKDGTNSKAVAINVVDLGDAVDIGGYRVKQYGGALTNTIPADTLILPGGYVVIGRDASQSEFESHWGVTFGSDVIYINSGNTMPQINGGETYELLNDLGATLDGPTPSGINPSTKSVQRTSANADGTLVGSWTVVADTSGNPGSGGSGDGTGGLVISEYSDATGTGNYIYEFVELYYDGGGGGSSENDPDVTITNPASSSVPNATASIDLSGTCNTSTIGQLRWTNSLTGGSGTANAGSTWAIGSVTLNVGANVITVTGTNNAGDPASDAITVTRLSAGGECGVIISEYVEGSANNKAIEVFNGTSSAIDLAAGQYILLGYQNGGTSPSYTVPLAGSLAAGGTHVVVHGSAGAALLAYGNQTNTLSFNGNDAVVLRSGGASGTIVDSLGRVGENPGTYWGTPTDNTLDHTLRRKASVTSGDATQDDAFDPALEWEFFSQDTFTGLGSHTMDCGGGGETNVVPVLSGLADQSVVVSNLLSFGVVATEPDGDLIALTASNLPANAAFYPTNGTGSAGGTFTFTPDASQAGQSYDVVFYAQDKDGLASNSIRIDVLSTPPADVTNLVFYDFEDDGGVFEQIPQTTAVHLAASIFNSYDGTVTNFKGSPGRAIADTGWDVSDLSAYFEFTLVVSNGWQVDVLALTFDDQASATGPIDWRVRHSGDGYAADLGSGLAHTSFTANSNAVSLLNLAGTNTFRIYGQNAGAASGTWRLDDVTLMGAVETAGSGDSDGDGLPDTWESQYFGGPTNADATAHSDADPASNGDEFVADTNPTNTDSYFSNVTASAAGFAVMDLLSGVPTTNTRVYDAWSSTSLIGNAWTPYGLNVPGAANGSAVTLTVTNDAQGRFYRTGVKVP